MPVGSQSFTDFAGNRQYITLGNLVDPEQVILFTVSTWDANCPQHIPQRFEAADVAAALVERDKRRGWRPR